MESGNFIKSQKISSENYKFFQNRECEFYPCHKKIKEENFNCLFCYCPLYSLKEECGGNFIYTKDKVKNCSNCILPHVKETGYEHIMKNIKKIIEKTKNT